METAIRKLVILGASGHGKVVADIAVKNGYTEIVFLDDNPEVTLCAGYPVLGPISMLAETEGDVFAAIGNARIRRKETERYPDRVFPTLIHPGAIIRVLAARKCPCEAKSMETVPEISRTSTSSPVPRTMRHQDIFPRGRQVLCSRICRYVP